MRALGNIKATASVPQLSSVCLSNLVTWIANILKNQEVGDPLGLAPAELKQQLNKLQSLLIYPHGHWHGHKAHPPRSRFFRKSTLRKSDRSQKFLFSAKKFSFPECQNVWNSLNAFDWSRASLGFIFLKSVKLVLTRDILQTVFLGVALHAHADLGWPVTRTLRSSWLLQRTHLFPSSC